MSPTIIIGGGVAGLAAAVRLVAAGREVVLFEQAPRLGGRASTFADRQTGEAVDNGQHVLFGCYRETYELLRTLGTDHLVPLQPRLDLTMADGEGRRAVLRCPPLPPPWHLVAAVVGWSVLPPGDRAAARFIWPILQAARRTSPEDVAATVPENETVDDWLTTLRQPEAIRRWLWYPLVIAALNQPASVAAARPFVRVLTELFGPRVENASVGLPAAPLGEVFAEPARRFIETRGGRVLTRTAARLLVADGRVTGVRANGEDLPADEVISAVAWHAFGALWPGEVPDPMHAILGAAAALESSPIVTANLWFDGPILSVPFVGMVDGTMQWAFDKGAIFRDSTRHLSLVASGAGTLTDLENEEIAAIALHDLHRALPESRSRKLDRFLVVREHRATFSLAPGGPRRPQTETPIRGLFLAGDWTDTGLPATIEGAVLSGRLAAEAVLAPGG